MSKEAMKLALEALECALSDDKPHIDECEKAIKALEEALAKQKCVDANDTSKERVAKTHENVHEPYAYEIQEGDSFTLVYADAVHKYKMVSEDAITETLYIAQQPAIGDVRALKHRIHALEGEVIGYKQILDAQEQGEPVAIVAVGGVTNEITVGWFQMPKHNDKLYTTPQQRKPLTHEQRFDLLTKFEPHKNKWEAPAILIDMVETAHGIKE